MDRFKQIQKDLVEKCERAHEAGIRQAGLVGTVCEDSLVDALQKDIPELNFGRGVIKLGNPEKIGSSLVSKDLSTQLDIVIYRGPPRITIANCVVVLKNQAVGIIEVKKWQDPKTIVSTNEYLEKLRKKVGSGIPVFLVAFRFKDRVKHRNWFTETGSYDRNWHYCFFGRYSRRNSRDLYPWEEDSWSNFENDYAGEYKRLVNSIKKLKK